jgi:GT2 family glycosyltransferase
LSEAPDVAVVVASHERPLRLRWLLNALEEQTAEHFEVVICDDSRDPEVAVLLAEHPLARRGSLRALRCEPGTGTAPRQRNLGWRAASAPLIAFTDDDCRPQPDWLECLLAAARRAPDGVLQGTTRPDPDEAALLAMATTPRTISVTPPDQFAQTCNIAYPRALLEALGGFDEALRGPGGEDTDLALRAQAAGAELVPVPEAIVNHAVEALGVREALRLAWRWRDLPGVLKRHPDLRGTLTGRLFWRRRHALALAALAGIAAGRPWVALPWVYDTLTLRGRDGVLRAASELPLRAAIDATELAALSYGSARHRSLFL